MILLIIKSYYLLLLSVGLGCLGIFLIGLYLIIKSSRQPKRISIVEQDAMTEEVAAIAGDNIFATQLDLAFAYIETNQKKSAQAILDHIVKQGSVTEQQEAKRLLGLL